MHQYFRDIVVNTRDISMIDITDEIRRFVADSKIHNGHCVISCLHTSASLLVQENASADVLYDLVSFFHRIAPHSSNYHHQEEGPDDMPAHIKTALTQTHLTLSVRDAAIVLGQWQGLFFCEFRNSPHSRTVNCHLLGD